MALITQGFFKIENPEPFWGHFITMRRGQVSGRTISPICSRPVKWGGFVFPLLLCIFLFAILLKFMRMDAVYCLGSGSRWQDNELRYSLRSLVKYVSGIEQVFVVGKKPAWLTGVIHLPMADRWNKERNIMEKVSWACACPDLSNDFLFLCDDYYALTLQDANVPAWASGDLLSLGRGISKHNNYRFSVLNTAVVLKKCGLPTHHFDVHTPIVYNKNRFVELMQAYDWDIRHGYVVNSLYANSAGIEPVWMADVKLNAAHTLQDVVRLVQGRPWWSVGDGGLTPEVKALLRELYPEKSRFEI